MRTTDSNINWICQWRDECNRKINFMKLLSLGPLCSDSLRSVEVVGVEYSVQVVALMLEDDCGEAAYGFSAVLQLR